MHTAKTPSISLKSITSLKIIFSMNSLIFFVKQHISRKKWSKILLHFHCMIWTGIGPIENILYYDIYIQVVRRQNGQASRTILLLVSTINFQLPKLSPLKRLVYWRQRQNRVEMMCYAIRLHYFSAVMVYIFFIKYNLNRGG